MAYRGVAIKHKILFLIPSLMTGGAERQLITLVKGLDHSRWLVKVVCFESGNMMPEVEALDELPGVSLVRLDQMTKSKIALIRRLIAEVRGFSPDILHGYLVSGQIYVLLLHLIVTTAKIVLGIRSSFFNIGHYGLKTRLMYGMVSRLSGWADAYIANSSSGANYYCTERGFDRAKMHFIPNGIDTAKFVPQPGNKQLLWQELSLQNRVPIIGIVGTIEHLKDHDTFIRAARIVHDGFPQVRFVVIGRDTGSLVDSVKRFTGSLGLSGVIHFLGLRHDLAQLFNGLDILVSSSIGEGFSNVIAEAMASGVPCVVTDVGDSARIVGETGFVVPARDPKKMADALKILLALSGEERRALGQRARERVEKEFGIGVMVSRTEAVYAKLLMIDQ
jgi:glycosyltransferase involved in cell wall biosynthesis